MQCHFDEGQRPPTVRWLAIVVPLLIALAACEGPEGPVGPTGPEGPPGAVRGIASSTIGADGTVLAEFPAGGGTLTDLPSLTCDQSETGGLCGFR